MNNNRLLLPAMALGLILAITSCKKEDEIKAPEFVSFELGYNNSGSAVIGDDLHIDAEILAEGKVANIRITIHHEGGHGKTSLLDEEWEVDSTYTTSYAGARNIDFHEHIDIPGTAEAGDYHFHLIVTDMEGNRTEKEAELLLVLPTDNTAPVVSISSAPAEAQIFTNGQDITISGTVTDETALGGMYIGLVRVAQGLQDSEVNATNTITLLHTHIFDTDKHHNFSASIKVGASSDNNTPPKEITGDIAWTLGEYYILVKAKDAFGGNWGFSQRYPVQIDI
ncbi:DUF4625 domain-containing protein [Lentimicrobium sp.]|jgi:hypothetical protein|uniref:DUF4625 domain-containing protein n=1 Tax=Lentimicrobium sp. TaxID=2034841 RepID=UPI002CB1618E|nr:DUF4625 domain-containing protein [Lentimicrobium sp.]HPJ63679.1 DUF4625 domain-containing protein [Lentimicrobium sp.]